MKATTKVGNPPAIPVIIGPTGCGKSGSAEQLARRGDVVLINSDPFQACRGMEIGTAAPADRSLYRLLGCFAPDEEINAAKYGRLMREQVEDVLALGKMPLLVGGSGFYLRAFADPLDPEPEIAAADVQRIRDLVQTDSKQAWMELNARDSCVASVISSSDQYRLEHALVRTWGKPSEQSKDAPVRIALFGLWGAGQSYEDRLRLRLEHMLDAGWEEEAKTCAERYGMDAPGMKALGYRELAEKGDHPETRANIFRATRRYAKRQRTWFRNRPVRWLPANTWGQAQLVYRLLQYKDGTFCRHPASDTGS